MENKTVPFLNLTKVPAVCACDALDTVITQTAEHDFILPDYCSDIFRVLKCSIEPCITSTAINGGRLTFDISALIRVIYRSEKGGVCCIEHTEVSTRSAEIPGDVTSPFVKITPSVQSVSCRVVDKRRLEVRGNIACRVKVETEHMCDIVSGAEGGGIQLRKQPVLYPSKRLTAAKRITVIEELELAEGKPAFGSVLRCGVTVTGGEGSRAVQTKVIPGKLVTKGEAAVQLLYLPKDPENSSPETMRFVIPFSQIIDMAGLEEDLDITAEVEPGSCLITPRGESGKDRDKDKDGSLLECELVLTVNIRAVKYESAELVTDAYSTDYELKCNAAEGLAKAPGKRLRISAAAAAQLGSSDGGAAQVYDVWSEGTEVFSRFDEGRGEGLVYGKLTFCMLGKLSDGTAFYSEKEAAFEQAVQLTAAELDGAQTAAAVTGCSYTLGTDGTVQARADVGITVTSPAGEQRGLLSDIALDTEHLKVRDRSCAARIVFGEQGLSLWDIAKKYSAVSAALTEENPEDSKVLIIPMN